MGGWACWPLSRGSPGLRRDSPRSQIATANAWCTASGRTLAQGGRRGRGKQTWSWRSRRTSAIYDDSAQASVSRLRCPNLWGDLYWAGGWRFWGSPYNTYMRSWGEGTAWDGAFAWRNCLCGERRLGVDNRVVAAHRVCVCACACVCPKAFSRCVIVLHGASWINGWRVERG